MKGLSKQTRITQKNEVQKKISAFFQKSFDQKPSLFSSVHQVTDQIGLPLQEANPYDTTEQTRSFPSNQFMSNLEYNDDASNSLNTTDARCDVPAAAQDGCCEVPSTFQASPDVIHPTPDASRKPPSRKCLLSNGFSIDSSSKCVGENKDTLSPGHRKNCRRKLKNNKVNTTNRCRLFVDAELDGSTLKSNTPSQTPGPFDCRPSTSIRTTIKSVKRSAASRISPNAKRAMKSVDYETKYMFCDIDSECIPPSQALETEKKVKHDISQSKLKSTVISKQKDFFDVNLETNDSSSSVITALNEIKSSCSLPKSCVTSSPEHHQNDLVHSSSKSSPSGKAEAFNSSWSNVTSSSEHANELWDNFDNMSPITTPTKKRCNVSPFLNSLGRHNVMQVDHSDTEGQVTLHLLSAENKENKICILRGFWTDTQVKKKDTVNVLADFDSNGIAVIDDSKGLLIVHPDHLLTGTGTVSTLFCMRKSVLMEKFKGTDPGNIAMLCGILVHEVFQEIMNQKAYTESEIGNVIKNLMRQPSTLQALYSISSSEKEMMGEIKKFIPQIRSWISKYVLDDTEVKNENSLRILNVQDIEENIWSPRFGIKGKIDLTVEVEMNTNGKVGKKILPLELKTGKASFSAEHRGQVTLYTMLCSDRRQDPEEGLLLYLRDGQMKRIPASHKEKRGLIQLRNELVHYLRQTPRDNQFGAKGPVLLLPPPIDSERLCRQCPYLMTCSIFLNRQQDLNLPPHHKKRKFMTESCCHLSPADLDYFFHWCHLLELDAACEKQNFLSSIYSECAAQRESKGEALSHTQLDSAHLIVESTAGGYLTTFSYKQLAQQTKNFAAGDMIVVSCESSGEFAVASGPVSSFTDKSVSVHLDKNLSLRKDWLKAIFRLDHHEYGSSSGLIAGNLLQLMNPGCNVERFRRLIICRQEPTFLTGLKKEIVRIARPILQLLNTPQIRAVFKSVMANDYLLIKGMPGTGKTTTTVALIRLLHALGHSVLLTSYTHSAVDTILLKLAAAKLDFLRLGRCSRIHPKLLPYAAEKLTTKIQTVKELAVFYNSKIIVATTCLGMGHALFKHRKFDFCILDEASQALQPSCLAPVLSANRFILVGDPHQLAPVVRSKKARELGMDESLFQRLDSPVATVNLTLQYRMNREIMRLPNELVYNGDLECGDAAVAQATLHIPHKHLPSIPSSCWFEKVLDSSLEASVLFFDTELVPAPESSGKSGLQNLAEANLVVHTTLNLVKGGVSPHNIGVISPYRCQVQLLKERLVHQTQVEVNTVDQYQGRDKDVILISCVRSTTSTELGEILHDMRRLNVAISRAKQKLLIFGNKSTLVHYMPFQKLFNILRPDQCLVLPENAHRLL